MIIAVPVAILVMVKRLLSEGMSTVAIVISELVAE
jgi:hypothetical protein